MSVSPGFRTTPTELSVLVCRVLCFLASLWEHTGPDRLTAAEKQHLTSPPPSTGRKLLQALLE